MLAPRAVKRKATASKPAAGKAAVTATSELQDEDNLKLDLTADEAMHAMMLEEEEYHRQSAIAASTSKACQANGYASTSKTSDIEQEEDPAEIAKKHADNLARLRIAIEETLSDWGLCHNPQLLQRMETSSDGCTPQDHIAKPDILFALADVHISNLLAVPAISIISTAMTDVTEALQAEPLENVQVSCELLVDSLGC